MHLSLAYQGLCQKGKVKRDSSRTTYLLELLGGKTANTSPNPKSTDERMFIKAGFVIFLSQKLHICTFDLSYQGLDQKEKLRKIVAELQIYEMRI